MADTAHHLLDSKQSASSTSADGKTDLTVSDASTAAESTTTLCGQMRSLWATFTAQVAARFRVRQSRAFAFWLFMLVVTGSGVNVRLSVVVVQLHNFIMHLGHGVLICFHTPLLPLAPQTDLPSNRSAADARL